MILNPRAVKIEADIKAEALNEHFEMTGKEYQGKIVDLNPGDVIIIPAGVGHFSVSEHQNYQFVGGYPNGHPWDLKTGLEIGERSSILMAISAVEMPMTDPIYGLSGPLFEKW